MIAVPVWEMSSLDTQIDVKPSVMVPSLLLMHIQFFLVLFFIKIVLSWQYHWWIKQFQLHYIHLFHGCCIGQMRLFAFTRRLFI